MAANRRSELWASKRVFFATPQIISNDLAKGVCPATLVKCVVVDEAHKALGNHAYCQVCVLCDINALHEWSMAYKCTATKGLGDIRA